MPENFTTEMVNKVLVQADSLSQVDPDKLVTVYSDWITDLERLFDRSTTLTYLPVLCVTLTARALSDTVDVRRIQPGDQYSAPLVARALLAFGANRHIDLRTDSSGLMNSKPFEKQAEITSDLTATPGYTHFYNLVQRVQLLASPAALGVLALAFHLGRHNWEGRYRRGQRSNSLPPHRHAAGRNRGRVHPDPH